ncbi:MAG: hypothetical protein ACRC7O_01635, partial [Fimbriiglobus sp.]
KDVVRLTTDTDPGVRAAALGTLSEMLFETKDEQKQVFEALRYVLANSFPGSQARLYSVRALAAYGGDAASPANIQALDQIKADTWWMTRQAVANGLGRLGAAVYDDPPLKDATGRVVPKRPASDAAAKSLRLMLENDKSAAVRLEAAYALLALGPPPAATPAEYAKAVGPALDAVNASLKKEKDGAVVVWLNILRSMYDDTAFPDTLKRLGAVMQDPSPAARGQALTAATMLGPRASTLTPQIRDFLVYDDPDLLAVAIPALAAVAAKNPTEAVADLEKFRARTTHDGLKAMAADAIAVLTGKKKAPPPLAADAGKIPAPVPDPKPMAVGKP